jgi:hypothetical protein
MDAGPAPHLGGCGDTDRLVHPPTRGVRRPREPIGVPHPISERDLIRALVASTVEGCPEDPRDETYNEPWFVGSARFGGAPRTSIDRRQSSSVLSLTDNSQ